MQQVLQGGPVFIQPPAHQTEQILLQYAHAKIADDTLTALLLLPANNCNMFTNNFVHLDAYPSNSKHWITPPDATYNLWYDPPGHNHQLAQTVCLTLQNVPQYISTINVDRLNMLFSAQVAGQQCIALLDTGASLNFISDTLVHRAGLKMSQATSTVWGAGNNKLNTKGTVTIPIRLGAYKARIQATVVDGIVPGVDLVLGQQFQQATHFNRPHRPSLIVAGTQQPCTTQMGGPVPFIPSIIP